MDEGKRDTRKSETLGVVLSHQRLLACLPARHAPILSWFRLFQVETSPSISPTGKQSFTFPNGQAALSGPGLTPCASIANNYLAGYGDGCGVSILQC